MSTKVENTEDSPVPVQLTGSNVGDEQAIPIKKKTSSIESVKGIVVTPGSTFNAFNQYQQYDVERATFVATSPASHKFQLRVVFYIDMTDSDAWYDESKSETSKIIRLVVNPVIMNQRINVRITNQDIVEHSYNVYKQYFYR